MRFWVAPTRGSEKDGSIMRIIDGSASFVLVEKSWKERERVRTVERKECECEGWCTEGRHRLSRERGQREARERPE